MTATNAVAIYDAVTGEVRAVIIPDSDKQINDPDGPCQKQLKALDGQEMLLIPTETYKRFSEPKHIAAAVVEAVNQKLRATESSAMDSLP